MIFNLTTSCAKYRSYYLREVEWSNILLEVHNKRILEAQDLDYHLKFRA